MKTFHIEYWNTDNGGFFVELEDIQAHTIEEAKDIAISKHGGNFIAIGSGSYRDTIEIEELYHNN